MYDLYAKLQNAPEMQQQNSGLDGTVIVVDAGRSDDGGRGGGAVGGDNGVPSAPSAFVAAPAAYATSE